MSVYQIQYELEDAKDHHVKHSRFYHAIDVNTAKEMLEETWKEGSLIGYPHPKILCVRELNQKPEQDNLTFTHSTII